MSEEFTIKFLRKTHYYDKNPKVKTLGLLLLQGKEGHFT